jgi:hypothetical protein
VSLPVLGGAAVVSSPALWHALVEGTTSTEVALTRYLASVAICWAVLAFVTMLVGPAPTPEPEVVTAEHEAEEPAPVR